MALTAKPQHLLQVALANVPLFRSMPFGEAGALGLIAEVTGIPTAVLGQVERLIVQTGSIVPLRELLNSPAVPKADGLRYELVVRTLHRGSGTRRERIGQRVLLQVSSPRGQMSLNLSVILGRRPLARMTERQTARVLVTWLVDTPARHHAFKHELTLAGDRPRLSPRWAEAA